MVGTVCFWFWKTSFCSGMLLLARLVNFDVLRNREIYLVVISLISAVGTPLAWGVKADVPLQEENTTSQVQINYITWSQLIMKHTHSTTHHSELVDHSRGPADVYTFIHHSYKQSVWVSVNPVERCALWVTHPDSSPISDVSSVLSQRTAVQPEMRGLWWEVLMVHVAPVSKWDSIMD